MKRDIFLADDSDINTCDGQNILKRPLHDAKALIVGFFFVDPANKPFCRKKRDAQKQERKKKQHKAYKS